MQRRMSINLPADSTTPKFEPVPDLVICSSRYEISECACSYMEVCMTFLLMQCKSLALVLVDMLHQPQTMECIAHETKDHHDAALDISSMSQYLAVRA